MGSGKKYLVDVNKILAHDDLKREEVDVPEWDGVVLVRAMSGSERTEYIRILTGGSMTQRGTDDRIIQSDIGRAHIYAAAVGMIDEDGVQIFGVDYIDQLEKKAGHVLTRIGEAVLSLSGITRDEEDEEDTIGSEGASLPLRA